jgi:hypothetical protein
MFGVWLPLALEAVAAGGSTTVENGANATRYGLIFERRYCHHR